MSEISKEAWTEARREMLELSKMYSSGHRMVRMADPVYEFICDAREGNLPWPEIFRVLHKRELTQYKMHESLQRAWRDEKRIREANNAAR